VSPPTVSIRERVDEVDVDRAFIIRGEAKELPCHI